MNEKSIRVFNRQSAGSGSGPAGVDALGVRLAGSEAVRYSFDDCVARRRINLAPA